MAGAGSFALTDITRRFGGPTARPAVEDNVAFGTAAAYSVLLIVTVLLITLAARAAEGRGGVMALRS